MPNWLASELCMGVCFAVGAWQTFKILKRDDGADYNLLKTWCLLGLLRAFEEYAEFLVSWVPFYWIGKCVVLGLLFLPGGNVSTVLFERVVVRGMDRAHHILNSMVVPNVVEFVVSLPWRLLLLLFPTLPPPVLSGGDPSFAQGSKRGLASRLQHLSMPLPHATDRIQSQHSERSPRLQPPRDTTDHSRKSDDFARNDSSSLTDATESTSRIHPVESESRAGMHVEESTSHRDGDDGERPTTRLHSNTRSKSDVEDGDPPERNDPSKRSVPLHEGADEDIHKSKSPEIDAPLSTPVAPRRNDPPIRAELVKKRRSTPPRRSLGDMVRSALTGDSKVRVRDHLFDLGTASPPLPSADNSGANRPAAFKELSGSSPEDRNNNEGDGPSTDLSASALNDATGKGLQPVPASRKTRPSIGRNITRRQPRTFLPSESGGDDKQQDGTSTQISSSITTVRRRSGRIAARECATACNRFGNTSTSGTGDADAAAGSRESKLMEWRRKRSKGASATVASSQGRREKPNTLNHLNNSRTGKDIDSTVDRSSTGQDGTANGACKGGTENIPRKSRHVERLRSAMATTTAKARSQRSTSGSSTLSTRRDP